MVRPERIELPTSWFVAMHSIQLSYGRIVVEKCPQIITETESIAQPDRLNPLSKTLLLSSICAIWSAPKPQRAVNFSSLAKEGNCQLA